MSIDQWPTMKRADLVPWPDLNPRRIFEDEDTEELRASLHQDGMLQPVGVKMNKKAPHWIYAGERRWRAAEGIMDDLPVMVQDITEAAARRLSLTENIQRESLTSMEEAWGLRGYLEASEKTQRVVAQELGKTQSWISNRLRLLHLPDTIQAQIQGGLVSASQARDLILPFNSLPAELWDMLSAAVATRLQKLEKKLKRAFVDEEIRMEVSAVAMSMSGWLDQPSYGAGEEAWATEAYHISLRTSKPKDWKGAPSGTVVKYRYGRYAHGHKTSRCFDATWWEDMMDRSAQAEKDRRAKLDEDREKGGSEEEDRDLEWTPKQGTIPYTQEIPWDRMHVVYEAVSPETRTWAPAIEGYHGEVGGRLNADPTEIDPKYLVLREGPGGNGYRSQGAVLCTDYAVFEAAQAALDEKEDGLVKRRWAEYLRAEKGASKAIILTEHLSELAVLGQFVEVYILADVAEAMKLEIPAETAEYSPESEGRVWVAFLQELKKDVREDLLRRCVYRAMEGSQPKAAATLKAQKRLQDTLTKELKGKLPFDLPTYKAKATKAGADTPTEEEEDAEG